MRPISFSYLVCLATVLAWAGPQRALTCAECHKAEARSQPKSAMGIGIELPHDQVQLQTHSELTFTKFGYVWKVERKGDQSLYTVSDGSQSLSLPIYYAFGAHMQTFVFPYQGRMYESTVSYYPSIEGLAITVGHEPRTPTTLLEALGREPPNEEVTACFGCHSSGAVREGKLDLQLVRPGVDCEHCHAGANAHQDALSHGKTGVTPQRLGRLTAEEMSNFCGKCHRTWEEIVRSREFGEANVRFQPYRLANSRCFQGEDSRIRCTACHDPHKDAVRETASYDHNCLACHYSKTSGPAVATVKMWKACPVGEKNCVSCHMERRQLPLSPAVFTDHQIRIVRPGERLPN